MPLARLAIAAFSNFPGTNYQNIFDSNYSIFGNVQTDKGQNVKINDFIYGSMCNPFYIMDEYDKIAGKPGRYFELCEPVDRIVDCYSKRKAPNINDIELTIKNLSIFAKLNTLIKVEEGIYSKEYAEKILDEFETIKKDAEKEYGISNIQKNNNHSLITPLNITQTSHQVVQNNPGQLSDKVKESKNIFSRILDKIKGRFRENR